MLLEQEWCSAPRHFAAIAGIIGIFAALFRRSMETSANRLVAVGAIAGLLALKWLSQWLEAGRWKLFGFYCIAASAAVFALHYGLGY